MKCKNETKEQNEMNNQKVKEERKEKFPIVVDHIEELRLNEEREMFFFSS